MKEGKASMLRLIWRCILKFELYILIGIGLGIVFLASWAHVVAWGLARWLR